MACKLWDVLGELRSDAYEWVDLTHTMNNESPYWAGIPEGGRLTPQNSASRIAAIFFAQINFSCIA